MTSEEPKPKGKRERLNWGLLSGYVIGSGITIVCFRIAAVMSPREWWLDIAIIFFAYALGWNVGMLLSPKPAEKREFAAYGKAITAFIGGFLIAKIDATFGPDLMRGVVADPVALTRLLIFGIEFLFGVQSIYMGRRYKIWLADQRRRTALQKAAVVLARRALHPHEETR